MIGLKKDTVKLFPHNPKWIEQGEDSVNELKKIFGDLAVDIRHIGSTAVSSLKAKPIIDIAIGLRRFEDLEKVAEQLNQSGYIRKPENDTENQKFLLASLSHGSDIRTHYIHVVKYGNTFWNSYIAFCDCLRKEEETRKKYEELKQSLAQKYANDRRAYTAGKSEFIKRILRTKCDIKERSCGAVVWRKRGGRRHYLIIQNRSGHNGFPKGHMEYGETEPETALREIYEETSLKVTLDTSFRAEYRYLVDGYIHKSALYFLASYQEGEFKPQRGEVYGIWLLPYEEAMEQLDYEQDRRVLRLAEKRLAHDEPESKR